MFLEMSPYIILGLIFVALLNYFVSKDLISRQIGKNNFWSVLKASLFGIPLPLCSCGVVPTAVYMSKSGASKGATVSFLISTPQTGIDSIIATYGMLGPLFAIFRPFAALVMGIFGGLAVRLISDEDKESTAKPKFIGLTQFEAVRTVETQKVISTKEKIKKTLNYSFVEFLDDISVQFVAGVIIAGLIAYFIPNDYFAETGFNSGILGMLLMILIGAPMYVCATASIPIAMALLMKGFSPGVAFVFLAVGPATNAASITIISKSLGKKVTMLYLTAIAVLSIMMGYLLDFVYYLWGEGSIIHNHHSHEHSDMFFSDDMKLILGIVFFVMIIMSFYRKYFSKYFNNKRPEIIDDGIQKIMISGMTCNHCVSTVSSTALKIKGIDEINIRLDEGLAYVKGKFDMNEFEKEINDVGYKIVK
ncbi:MAG: SO_0444 family Cu/Zn efflux transporter [Candidatus Kapabacteria bacterium]|nr:SO_0444 family Cu/Zn efflux transporter [Ignavibacteriota bacterium]MCW5884585.1 SO_0444 family Cu/Zn efflux transporter [Candidatus Kapabacteria bacterium]